jgi:hypothetical protein
LEIIERPVVPDLRSLGEVGLEEGARPGHGEVELGRHVDPYPQLCRREAQHVAGRAAVGAQKVDVVARHVEALGVIGEAEADQAALDPPVLELGLIGGDFDQRRIGFLLQSKRPSARSA